MRKCYKMCESDDSELEDMKYRLALLQYNDLPREEKDRLTLIARDMVRKTYRKECQNLPDDIIEELAKDEYAQECITPQLRNARLAYDSLTTEDKIQLAHQMTRFPRNRALFKRELLEKSGFGYVPHRTFY